MGWLSDNLGFEAFNLKDMGKKIKKNPLSLVTGVDEISNGIWNKARGQDNESVVNMWGGPTEEAFGRAENQGVNTGPARGMHAAAQTIAQMYAGNGLMNIGGTGGAATSNGIPVGNQMDHSWQKPKSNFSFGGGGGGGMPQLPGMGGGMNDPNKERMEKNREMLALINALREQGMQV